MTRSKQTGVSAGTREALILAAERLFAENGIDAVSLRQINAEAGQRNSSAAHYHFGSKEALVRSIYEYRLERVNQRRQAMLDVVRAEGRDADLRSIVETIIYPVIEEITDSDGGTYYIRFLAQAMDHPQKNIRNYTGGDLTSAATEGYELLLRILPNVNMKILGLRFGLMWEMMIHSLADRERQAESSAGDDERATNLFIGNLVDVISGGLSAPVSKHTARGAARGK